MAKVGLVGLTKLPRENSVITSWEKGHALVGWFNVNIVFKNLVGIRVG